MAELSKSELISYIREVFRLEHKKYAIFKMRDDLLDEITELKDREYPCKPTIRYVVKIPPEKEISGRTRVLYSIVSYLWGIFFFIFPILLYSYCGLDTWLESNFDIGYDEFVPIVGVNFLVSMISVICMFFFLQYSTYFIKLMKYNKEHNELLKKAERELEENLLKYADVCKKIDYENKQLRIVRDYKQSICMELSHVVDEIDNSLEKLYSYNIIHKKYCNYNSICCFLNYFELGRVDSLKEAINMYEDDLFKGKVLETLDEIAFNQELTYDAIRENNMLIQGTISNMDTIISQNEKISDYQQLAAANSKDILDSVQNIDFRQTIDMLDRLSSH